VYFASAHLIPQTKIFYNNEHSNARHNMTLFHNGFWYLLIISHNKYNVRLPSTLGKLCQVYCNVKPLFNMN